MTEYNFYKFNARIEQGIQRSIAGKCNLHDVLRFACGQLAVFSTDLQQTAVKRWAELSKQPLQKLQSFLGIATEDGSTETSLIQTITNALSNYTIKQNIISKEISYFKDSTEIDEAQIFLEQKYLKHGKHKVSKADIKEFLKPENINLSIVDFYNPLYDYFLGLRYKYKGEPVIQKLAKCIPAYDFGHPEQQQHYQDRLAYYLHKFLCKFAGQALNLCINEAAFYFTEPDGGTGKSKFWDWLFDRPEFAGYYVRLAKIETHNNMTERANTKLVLNFDDIKMRETLIDTYKSIITQDTGSTYIKGKGDTSYKRILNIVGTTNKANRCTKSGKKRDGFMFDDDAFMRRMITVDVGGPFDYKYYMNPANIEWEQVMAQAVNDAFAAKESNNEKILDYQCDYEELKAYNRRFITTEESSIEEKIETYIHKPTSDKNTVVYTASEILSYLRTKYDRINISPVALGVKLSQLRFKEGRKPGKRGEHGWCIMQPI